MDHRLNVRPKTNEEKSEENKGVSLTTLGWGCIMVFLDVTLKVSMTQGKIVML